MHSSPQRWAWIISCVMLTVAAWIQAARAQEQVARAEEQVAQADAAAHDEYYELMRVFVDTFEQIDKNYVKDVDRRELVEAAVRGMLAKLDPYSDYISPEDLAKFNEAVEQEFGGVGIQVHFDREHRNIQVMTPLPGSPAYKAGIRAGDRIVEIEGKPVKDFAENRELPTAVEMLKGEVGKSVTIGVQHPGSSDVEKVTLTREIITLDTVLGDTRHEDGTWDYMLDSEKKIGYLRLTHFTRRSAEEMRSALRELRKQGMQALVLDLRYNPGGLLQAAVEIADMFIEDGIIVSTDGRNSRHNEWRAKKFGTYSGFPMAVLVNRFSASASEIVSACLQDHNRAVVVGERSWGKGSVQNVIPLEGGSSSLKLTTASYHRPSGKNIHRFPNMKESDEWGVMPNDDYKVEFSPEQASKWWEYRQERDLPRSGDAPENDFKDSQLTRALEYVEKQIASGQPDETGKKPADDEAPPATGKKAAAGGAALVPLVRMKLPHAA
jgi:carboxyl-terminal processing protease